jgi:2-polyprenyl-6-methoxyphenol hydroxylase-like FAD-dependent oxidoreductase
LIIGADGAWSKAREAVPGVEKPFYSGVSGIQLTIPHLSTDHPKLSKMVGKGIYWALGPHKSIVSQRGSMGSARIYLQLSSSSPSCLHDSGLEGLTGQQLKPRVLNLFESWGEEVKELIAAGCESETGIAEARPLYMLPVGNTWTHTPGLTLIGDAAHLMTPFAGEGVNCAMLDALEFVSRSAGCFGCYVTCPNAVSSRVIHLVFHRHQHNCSSSLDSIKLVYQHPLERPSAATDRIVRCHLILFHC